MASHNRAISPEFTQLVADQHQQLRSFVRMLGVAPDWVDDLAQEALLVAWREQDSFDGQWVHLATVYDADQACVTHYVNGERATREPLVHADEFAEDRVREEGASRRVIQ